MSVIGIDFGNESCYVAVAKAGGIETIANDYSLRATPSCVAFTEKNRILGVAAKNQLVTNMKNTISGFKHLLGRKYRDPVVQNELHQIPYKVEECQDGGIGIRVNYLNEEQVFTPEQILGMLFTKLKDTSTVALQAQVHDCVISVPSYYTNAERRALQDAAAIAGLNVLRLINETTATALQYGFYKQDLPAPEEKPRNVVFVDFGHSSIQISVCAFNKSKLKMLAAASDRVGGRDVDIMLADHFSKEFIGKYKIDPRTNKKAFVRLLAEIEKLKKQMSANSTKLPLNIECFMNDIDVHSSISRVEMEELCSNLFKRIEETMKKCLKDSKLTPEEIHSVEIVGGSSRIPAVKQLIEQIFGKTASTTLNQDEAVSRGAALQCAIMSPAVRVRDFSIVDIQPYSVMISFDNENGQRTDMEVFPANHAAPFSRLLTMYRRDPFSLQLYYSDPSPYLDPLIGQWQVNDVKPNANGESQEVKIKVRINHNGVILISSAQMVEKKDATETEQNGNESEAQQQATPPNAPQGENPAAPQSPKDGPEPMEQDDDKKDKKKKCTNKVIELPIIGKTHGYSTVEFNKFFEFEGKMISNDRQEKERIDARNALEEYVYEIRNKLQEDGELHNYVEEQIRQHICTELDDLENWLYEEGEHCEREVYRTRLTDLHGKTDPIKQRHIEYEGQAQVFNELGHAIQMSYKAIEQYRKGDPKYDHLTETEILNITESTEKTQKWFDDARNKLHGLNKTQDPPIKLIDFRHEYQTLNQCVNSVLTRPKPTPPPAPKPEENHQNGNTEQQQQQEQSQQSEQQEKQQKTQHSQPNDQLHDQMDVE